MSTDELITPDMIEDAHKAAHEVIKNATEAARKSFPNEHTLVLTFMKAALDAKTGNSESTLKAFVLAHLLVNYHNVTSHAE